MNNIAIGITFFAALLTSVHAQTIERVKMTDNDHNCQQIFQEIGQMDGLISKSASPVAATQTAQASNSSGMATGVVGAVAQEAVARSGFGAFGGLGGMFGGIAQSLAQGVAAQQSAQASAIQQQAAQAQQNQALVGQQAQGRKEHLTGLFLSKGCKMSDVQK